MRDAKKGSTTEYFSHVMLTKEALVDLLNAIKQPDELVEIKIGEVIFEGLEEITAHKESLRFPMEIEVGKISIQLDAFFRNRVTGPPEDRNRIESLAKEINKFRNPFRWLNSFMGFGVVFVFYCILIAFMLIYLLGILVDKVTIDHVGIASFAAIGISGYLASQTEKLSRNRFSRKASDTFLRRYGDKILPSVASSLITAGAIWIFANWDKVESFLGLLP